MAANTSEAFRDSKADTDLGITMEWTRNEWGFEHIAYSRALTHAIQLKLQLQTVEGDVITVREEAAYLGTSWFFAGPIFMREGDKLIFTTVGAQAGENHKVLGLGKVGVH